MQTVYDKIRDLKKIVHAIIPKISDSELHAIIDHIQREKEGSRKYLTNQERLVKDILLKYDYNPKTVVYWFHILRFPKYLQEQIKQGIISVSQAKAVYRDYRMKNDKQMEAEIIGDIRKYLNNLDEFIDEVIDDGRQK